eukprot:2772303-Prymnesium_polylepis.1
MSARSSLCIVPNSAPSNGARSPTCSATSCSCTTCVSSSFGSTESTSDRRMCRSFDPIPFTRSATTCVASVRLMSDNTSSNPASRSSRESALRARRARRHARAQEQCPTGRRYAVAHQGTVRLHAARQ